MSGIINYIGVSVLKVTSDTDTVPEGFKTCSFANTGSANATLTQNGQSWTLPSGAVFNLDSTRMTDAWYAVVIDASSTTVEATYY